MVARAVEPPAAAVPDAPAIREGTPVVAGDEHALVHETLAVATFATVLVDMGDADGGAGPADGAVSADGGASP